jgi:hypothetical protein
MFNYDKMLEPFTADGLTYDLLMSWVKKKSGAEQSIIDQAFAETMDSLASGEKFERPCQCGCGGEPNNIHTPISHYLLMIVQRIQKDIIMAQIGVVQERQKRLIEEQLKKLSDFDKEYDKMINGNWFQKNCPTFSKWIGKGVK